MNPSATLEAGLAEPTLPRDNGAPAFDAPWQGRALAMAVLAVERTGQGWDSFRRHLVDAIALDPARPYWESWVAALDALLVERGIVDPADDRVVVRDEPGMGRLEVFSLPVDEATLLAVLRDLFERHWRHIRFGMLLQGAVFEIRASGRARIGMLDGYATIDLGASHFHLCIGEHRGSPGSPTDPALARHRRCHRAELYRVLHDGAPVAWGMRMFNGADEQQLTVMLPNPFLDDDQRPTEVPDWDRLTCWDELRSRYLALPPDPRDRTATRFHHD